VTGSTVDPGAAPPSPASKVTITTGGHTVSVEAVGDVDHLAKLAEELWGRTRFGNAPPGFGMT
jgi:hypothetical protein